LSGRFNDAFGEEKSHHEDFVVARSSHENSEWSAIDDDLQRFLNGNDIIVGFFSAARPFGDLTGERRFGHVGIIPNFARYSRPESLK
jgi:hypothetical protein